MTHWPVQLKLVPPGAPFLKGADLLLVALGGALVQLLCGGVLYR